MLRRIFRIEYVPLGRWTRTSRSVNAIKIDWANTDHCGTCSLPQTAEPPKEEPPPDLKISDEKNRNE
jgi:hypothetical protein